MRILMLVPVLLLAACQGAAINDEVGSEAWLEKVDQRLSVSDGEGHGPDYGSREWCRVVHIRLYGKEPTQRIPCDQAWMETVDRELKKR